MDITFNVPHAFHPASTPDGKADALRVLQSCLVRLNSAPAANGVDVAKYYINGRLVVWTLPHVFGLEDGDSLEIESRDENAFALRCLLDCLIELNLSYLKYGRPCKLPRLYDLHARGGIYYYRTQIWDTLPGLYGRGFGDCKSLTAALVAQYLHEGKECAPVFRFQRRPDGSGALDFHILVQTADGFEDPSKVLGMGKNEVAPIR